MQRKSYTEGFTLMELVIVLTIMTILAGISLPSLSSYARNAKEMERIDHEALVQKAIRQYYAYEGNYPDLTDLSPEDGSLSLTEEQQEQLRDRLRSVTSARINITDYHYTYNEATGACSITRN